jgi:hypothetical protein
MKNELLERTEETNAAAEVVAVIDRAAATDIFRRQEPFWKQVRKRIVEKDPDFLEVWDRLY